jgi:hypothetical protein
VAEGGGPAACSRSRPGAAALGTCWRARLSTVERSRVCWRAGSLGGPGCVSSFLPCLTTGVWAGEMGIDSRKV